MVTEESKKKFYKECRHRTGLSQREWGRLMSVGKGGNSFQAVAMKESESGGAASRGVNMPEALAAQLLAFLHDHNYNVGLAEFDDTGKLIDIPLYESPGDGDSDEK